MITTIQLREKVKNALEKMKEGRTETYEDVIVKMIYNIREQKRKQED